MSGRGVRDRSRRDYPARSTEKSHHGRNNPPSRHLWVGNLSHNISENTLTSFFLKLGDLESVAFQPGRSYAFINFRNEDDAFAAMRELQGFVVAGNPLKIEFTKAEKSSAPSSDEEYFLRRDQQISNLRGSPYSERDSRIRHSSADSSYSDRSKNERNTGPSEVLWIGFPALLKVDEIILRKAFSPFGDIDKITAFPGRSYAFVRFKTISAACRAKETLQGKLFDNPRVHICFAKSESGASNSGRNSINAPPSPHSRPYGHHRSPERLRHDRKYGSLTEFSSDVEPRDPDFTNFSRKRNFWSSGSDEFEKRRFQDVGPEFDLPGNMYENRPSSPRGKSSRFHDFSPRQFPQQGLLYDDAWDLPEDTLSFQGGKKIKIGPIPHENELPEYPFADPEQMKRSVPRTYPDLLKQEALDNSYELRHFDYNNIPVSALNSNRTYRERDHLSEPIDGFRAGPISNPPNSFELKRSTPEVHKACLNGEWKWEGTIAKGGTPVCRATCFPVGKSMDMILPEFLDCTAKTSLDMLAKHYYQAAGSWVVFFVPHSDADIGFYNEFMNYLEEKQRAAVAKLDEKTTLFLVPPSEFSEKVLKVPGKLSISGVVLRLEQFVSNSASHYNPNVKQDPNFMSHHGDISYAKRTSPPIPGPYSAEPSFPSHGKAALNTTSFSGDISIATPASFSGSTHAYGNASNSYNESKRDYAHNQRNPMTGQNWPPHLANQNTARNLTSQIQISAVDSMVRGYNVIIPKDVQESGSSNHLAGISSNPVFTSGKLLQDARQIVSSSISMSDLQAEQLAQLASSLIEQQQQTGGVSTQEGFRQLNAISQVDNTSMAPNMLSLPNSQSAGNLVSQFGQSHSFQQQQVTNVPVMPQRSLQTTAPENEQLQGAVMQSESDADPQKRLQATLQLAAALLQQIQQQKGT